VAGVGIVRQETAFQGKRPIGQIIVVLDPRIRVWQAEGLRESGGRAGEEQAQSADLQRWFDKFENRRGYDGGNQRRSRREVQGWFRQGLIRRLLILVQADEITRPEGRCSLELSRFVNIWPRSAVGVDDSFGEEIGY